MPPPLGAYETMPHRWPYASLYRAMSERGVGPAETKLLALWEAGAVLGQGFPDSPDEPDPGDMGTPGGRDVMAEHVEWLLARQRGEDPDPPMPDMPDRATQERLMLTVGGV